MNQHRALAISLYISLVFYMPSYTYAHIFEINYSAHSSAFCAVINTFLIKIAKTGNKSKPSRHVCVWGSECSGGKKYDGSNFN